MNVKHRASSPRFTSITDIPAGMGHNRAKTPYLGSLADDDYEKRPNQATTHQLLILTESSIPRDENEGFVDVESQKMT